MSVLEATIFYTRAYTQDLKDDVVFGSRTISYSTRRIIGYVTVGSICALGVLYIYLVGSVIGSGFAQESLREQHEALYAQVQNTERAALQEGKVLTSEFFVSKGYYEPRLLETITRNRNVAEAPHDSYFY